MKEFYADYEREKYIVVCEKEEMTKEIKKLCLWSPIIKKWVSKCKCTVTKENTKCKATEYNFWKTLLKNGFKKIDKEAEYTKEELENKKIERLKQSIIKNKEKAKKLKSEFEKHSGDISFFTQPNIVDTARGLSFTRYRERVLSNYKKGVELEVYIKEQENKLNKGV